MGCCSSVHKEHAVGPDGLVNRRWVRDITHPLYCSGCDSIPPFMGSNPQLVTKPGTWHIHLEVVEFWRILFVFSLPCPLLRTDTTSGGSPTLEGANFEETPILWLVGATWSMLDFESTTSSWLADRDDCALCAQEVETLDHLLTSCVYSCETWSWILRFVDL